jgi:hypothetical protein
MKYDVHKFYDISNDLDMIENKMQCFANAIETIASADRDDLSSGTLWFLHDTVKNYAYEICKVSMRTMDYYRELQESGQKNAKGKK